MDEDEEEEEEEENVGKEDLNNNDSSQTNPRALTSQQEDTFYTTMAEMGLRPSDMEIPRLDQLISLKIRPTQYKKGFGF